MVGSTRRRYYRHRRGPGGGFGWISNECVGFSVHLALKLFCKLKPQRQETHSLFCCKFAHSFLLPAPVVAMADTLVFKRQFEGHAAHCELHHEGKILRIVVRDLRLVGKKELKECLNAIKEHIEHKLPESMSSE